MELNQREYKVTLPIGFKDETGRVHRQATIRKMRGHEEALLYDASYNAGQLVTELIRNCLVQLGDLESIEDATVSQLYTADRNYLLLELRRITLGDKLHAVYICPRCGNNVSVMEDLGQLEVRRLDESQTLDEIALKLEDGYVDREGTRHVDMVLTLPRGVDEEFLGSMAEKDPLKVQDAFLLRCITSFGTLKKAALEAYGVKMLRELTLGDRQRLKGALNGQLPGVDFQRSIQCNECGLAFKEVLDVSSFFALS